MAQSISFSDIQRVKRRAKQLHTSNPNVPLGKHRDMAAQELFSARHFHELNQWRNSTISQCATPHDDTFSESLTPNDNVVTCTFCGFLYCTDLKEDLAQHRVRHGRFEEATSALGYVPEQHAAREARKKVGHEQMSSSDLDIRLAGALEVLRGWFDRSLDSAIDRNYWKKHPDFGRYVSYLTGDLPGFPPDVIPILINQYGRQDGIIERGKSYWYPPK